MKHFFKQTLAIVMLCTLWSVAQAQNPKTLFMIGNACGGWDTEKAIQMQGPTITNVDGQEHAIFTGTVYYANYNGKTDPGFKFYEEANWNAKQYGPTNEGHWTLSNDAAEFEKDLTLNSGNEIKLGADFTRDLTVFVEFVDGQGTVKIVPFPDNLYLIGNGFGNWTLDNPFKLSNTARGVYTATLPKEQCWGAFKIFYSPSWADPVIGSNESVEQTLNWGNNKWTTVEAKINKSDDGAVNFNFGTVPAGKSVQVLVNLKGNSPKVSFVVAPETEDLPETLYINGLNGDWNNWQSMTKKDGKYSLERVSVDNDSEFQIFFNSNWEWSPIKRIVPAANKNDENKLNYNHRESPAFYWEDAAFGGTNDFGSLTNFNIRKGLYNIVYDPATETVSVEPVDGDIVEMEAIAGFWEGPVNEALKGDAVEASDKWFGNLQKLSKNGRDNYVISLPVYANEEDVEEVLFSSQFYLAVPNVKHTKLTWNDNGICDVTTVYESHTGYTPLYVDAHTENTTVPIFKGENFWCDNSRMEVGMKVKTIFLTYVPAWVNNPDYVDENDANKSDFPFALYFSSDGEFNAAAPVQPPFNSDSYSITMSEGPLYEALKGTRTDDITIDFVRHAPAEEGFLINLGKQVTMTSPQKFVLTVKHIDGSTENRTVTLNNENTEVSTAKGDGESTIGQGVIFNQIILMVDADKFNHETNHYDDITMWLRNGTAKETAPKKFNANMRLPMLKVWGQPKKTEIADRTTEWTDMMNAKIPAGLYDGNQVYTNLTYESGKKLALYDKPEDSEDRNLMYYQEGTVRYFAFSPVTKQNEADEETRTNLFFLDIDKLTDNAGVGVHKPTGEMSTVGGRKVYKKLSQFNLLDQDGYDVSNTWNGSQFIYPDAWWCADPNLQDDNGPRTLYAGTPQETKFKRVPEFESRVDLAWNLPDDKSADTKIHGITLFKIMGRAYDVYSKGIDDMNMFYIYAETDQSKIQGETLREKAEQTAPIMIRVKKSKYSDIKFEAGKSVSEFKPVYNNNFNSGNSYSGENKVFNIPTLVDGDVHYMLNLSKKVIEGNADLNYVAPGIAFDPMDHQEAIGFIDVTGTQKWMASPDDMLRPNEWSNYYSGNVAREANALQIHRPDREYYKAVLATNVDQVRYQILAPGVTVEMEPRFEYASINGDFDKANKLIYPVAKIKGKMLWPNGAEKMNVTLTATQLTDNELILEEPVFKVESFENLTEDSPIKLLNGENNNGVSSLENAFFEEGDRVFEYDFGTYHVIPGMEVKATANYTTNGVQSKTCADETNENFAYPVPVIESIEFVKEPIYAQENGNWNVNKVVADIKVTTSDDRDFPRYYELLGADVSGINSVANNLTPASNKDADKAYAEANVVDFALPFSENEYGEWGTYADNDHSHSNTFYNVPATMYALPGETDKVDDSKKNKLSVAANLSIAYWARAIYNFAIPTAGMKRIEPAGVVSYASDANPLGLNFAASLDDLKLHKLELHQTFSTDGTADGGENSGKYMPIVKWYDGGEATGIENVNAENGPVEYYTIQGIRVENPTNGIYIRVQSGKSEKVLVK